MIWATVISSLREVNGHFMASLCCLNGTPDLVIAGLILTMIAAAASPWGGHVKLSSLVEIYQF